MRSLTYKLSGIFLIICVVPLIIGIAGAMSLRTARDALDANNESISELATLISSASESLTGNIKLQVNSRAVAEQISNSQKVAGDAFKEMENVLLPSIFSLAELRYQLNNAAGAEAAMFLLLNMRHLDSKTLHSELTIQRGRLDAALESIARSQEIHTKLMRDIEGMDALNVLAANLQSWRENNDEFIDNMEQLTKLANDLIRGGPLFAATARKAYNTLFANGMDIRLECEKNIDELNRSIARLADDGVRRAMQFQNRSQSLIDDLNRDSEGVANKAEELRQQIESAGNISASAVRQSEEAMSKVTTRYWRMIAFSLIVVLLALAVGLSFAVRISRPIISMAVHMASLAKGDLSVDVTTANLGRGDEIGKLARALQAVIESNRAETRLANAMAAGDYTRLIPLRSESDQLGRALATMLVTSNEILRGVAGAITRMGKGAQEVSNTSRSLSQGAMTSASALEEISRSVSNIDDQAKENAGQARHANNLATASRDAAKRGYDAVNELVAAMKEIQQSGKRIATVAKLIDDIAFQTNLLALNAAVEAARAGRHGKGFSVVADEVRSLSGRSAKAARETGDMVTAMTARMEAGAVLAARTDQEFREIVGATDQVAQIFSDIAVASNDQSKALAQISAGLSQIDMVIQDTTVNAKETAAAAISLEEQTESLRRSISRFRLLPGDPAGGARDIQARPDHSDPGRPQLESSTRRTALPLAEEGTANRERTP
ncbi:MAG: methyl-accepting chemotaxis protein [Planctomycetota bacterium]|jgi:methyl-accepting chemotaxis protein|nr:methyl-accepting chemotaxis protein [Planctomycetota bacterium]